MARHRRLAANLFSGMANNIFRICIQIVMLPLMARLLGPSELGLYALALPMITFVMFLAEAGLGESLAQEKSENSLVWSSAFWGIIGAGTILSTAVYAASFMVARLSDQPRLPEIMLPLCSTLFMVAATVIPTARLLRDGKLIETSIGDFLATISGAGLAVYLAVHEAGVWAIVVQFVSTYFIRMVILNVMSPFVPRFEFSLKSVLSHTAVGGAILGGRLIDLGSRMIENSLISRSLGITAVGSYGYANQIGRFFSDAVSNPIWANLYYFAIRRSEDEAIAHYAGAHRLFALIAFPAVVMMALILPGLVPVLLGPKWVSSIGPITVMVVSCPFSSLGWFCSAIFFARRQTKMIWSMSIGAGFARIISVLIAMPYGVFGLTIGLSIINIASYLFTVFYLSPRIGVKRSELLKSALPPLLAAIVMGGFLKMVMTESISVPNLSLSLGAGCLIYAATLFLVDTRRTKSDLIFAVGILTNRGAS